LVEKKIDKSKERRLKCKEKKRFIIREGINTNLDINTPEKKRKKIIR